MSCTYYFRVIKLLEVYGPWQEAIVKSFRKVVKYSINGNMKLLPNSDCLLAEREACLGQIPNLPVSSDLLAVEPVQVEAGGI